MIINSISIHPVINLIAICCIVAGLAIYVIYQNAKNSKKRKRWLKTLKKGNIVGIGAFNDLRDPKGIITKIDGDEYEVKVKVKKNYLRIPNES